MADLTQIVVVNIDRQTTAVTRAGFGTGMILGLDKTFLGLSQTYSNLAAIVADGYDTSSSVYITASQYFGQSPSPTSVVVGRQDTADTTVVTAQAAAGGGQGVGEVGPGNESGVAEDGIGDAV